MRKIRGHQLLNWAVVICSLLLPLTATAGTLMSLPGGSGCGMIACQCDCCQPGARPQCQKYHTPCVCPGLPALTTSYAGPEIDGLVPYKPVTVKPVARILIASIYHPPRQAFLS